MVQCIAKSVKPFRIYCKMKYLTLISTFDLVVKRRCRARVNRTNVSTWQRVYRMFCVLEIVCSVASVPTRKFYKNVWDKCICLCEYVYVCMCPRSFVVMPHEKTTVGEVVEEGGGGMLSGNFDINSSIGDSWLSTRSLLSPYQHRNRFHRDRSLNERALGIDRLLQSHLPAVLLCRLSRHFFHCNVHVCIVECVQVMCSRSKTS